MRRFLPIVAVLSLSLSAHAQIYTPEINVTSSTNGKIGIGTSTPQGLLHLVPTAAEEALIIGSGVVETTHRYNSITFTEPNAGSGDNGIRWLDGSGNLAGYLYGEGANGFTVGSQLGSIDLKTSSQSRLWIDNSGNVGIGTTNPTRNLEVYGSNPAIIINDSGTSDPVIIFQDAGSSKFSLRVDESNSNAFEIRDSGNASKLLIEDGGNVGIGTTTPTSFFQVQKDGTNGWFQNIKGHAVSSGELVGLKLSTGYNAEFNKWSGIAAVAESSASNDTGLAFYAKQGEKMRINANGNVGIGTTTPNEKLHVKDGNLKIELASTYSNKPIIELGHGAETGADPYIYLYRWTGGGSNYFGTRFRASGNGNFNIEKAGGATYGNHTWSSALSIKTNGNVGIGTESPSYALDVVGQVRADNVSVSSDRRLKENISPLTTNDLRLITGHQYNLKKDGSFHYGVIAQEVEKIYPHMVSTDEKGYKSVAYNEFIPLLIEKVKEQDKMIETQAKQLQKDQSQFDDQQKQIDQLKSEISELKNLLLTAKSNEN